MAKKNGLAAILAREKQNNKISNREKYAVQKQQQMKDNAKAKRRKQNAPKAAKVEAMEAAKVETVVEATTGEGEELAKPEEAEETKEEEIEEKDSPAIESPVAAPVFKQTKSLIPFEPTDHVLLVGEGDFSFAVSILKQNLVKMLTSTSLDDEKTVASKYPDTGPANVEFLRNFDGTKKLDNELEDEDLAYKKHLPQEKPFNCAPMFGIDGTKLNTIKSIRQTLRPIPRNFFDVILFNFPHTGSGIKDQDRNVLQHQKLIDAFFKASRPLMRPKTGSIVVSLFDGLPYSLWNLKLLAKSHGLSVRRSGKFDWAAFPGYYHRLTAGRGDTTKQAGDRAAKFFVFEAFEYSNRSSVADQRKKKQKEHQIQMMKGKKKKRLLSKSSRKSSDDESD